MKRKRSIEQRLWTAQELSKQVEALGFLIQFQNLDIVWSEEIHSGVGDNLEKLGQRIRRVIQDVIEDLVAQNLGRKNE